MIPWEAPSADLDRALEGAEPDLRQLRGARILVTGGTGFLGRWLVAALSRAHRQMRLDLHLRILTRAPELVSSVTAAEVELVRSDIRSIRRQSGVDLVIHGAASSGATFGTGEGHPRSIASTIVHGTEMLLEAVAGSKPRLLFLSSGAVYGPQTRPVAESSKSMIDLLDPRHTYAQAKMLAENLCISATETRDVDAVIARLFTFVGPGIPLDRHYAAGNFVADVLAARPVHVAGDGRPVRSYLYAGDLPEWCFAIATRGRSQEAYNVGSPDPITIRALAKTIAELAGGHQFEITGQPAPGPQPWYVPTTTKAERELGLKPRTELSLAIKKTIDWYRE